MSKQYGLSLLKSYINKDSHGYEITLEQLETMNLPPTIEKALFGRTAKEWRESKK